MSFEVTALLGGCKTGFHAPERGPKPIKKLVSRHLSGKRGVFIEKPFRNRLGITWEPLRNHLGIA